MPNVATALQYDAFISYARADGRDLAERLYLALEEQGLRPWRDERDLNPYQDFSVGIERAIRASRYVIVLLTSEVAVRDDSFVRREILEAQARHKPIISLIAPRFDPADVPIHIKHLTWLSFTDLDEELPTLLERLAKPPLAYTPPMLPDDPFRPYVERLRDFVVGELEVSLLNIHELLLLRAKDTPDAVQIEPPLPLPAAFKSRVLAVNPQATKPIQERDFDNFNDGFAAHDGRILLLGEPGAGKTTTLLAFVREKVNARLVNPATPLPVYAPLTNWEGKIELADWLADATGLNVVDLRQEIIDKRALLILDGLDEMNAAWRDPDKPDVKPRDFRTEFLEKLKPIETQVLISCRVKDYYDIIAKGKEKVVLNGAMILQPLADQQIKAYLKDQPELWDALQADSALMAMARTPLLLTLLTIGYRDSTLDERTQLRDLSTSPGDLRDRIFANYVRKRYEHEHLRSAEPLTFTLEQVYPLLGQIAMMALSRRTINPIGDPITNNIEFYLGDRTQIFIDQSIRLHFLVDSYGDLNFAHLLLQDYFAFHYSLICLNHEDDSYREMATTALGLIGNAKAVEALIMTIKDKNKLVRLQAVHALGNLKDTRAVEPLIDLLKNDEWDSMRQECCSALGKIGDARALETLISIFENTNEDTDVAVSAAYALGHINDLRAIDPLISALRNPFCDYPSAVAAAYALGSIGHPRVIDPLIKALSDTDGNVQRAAINVLGRMGELVIPSLISLLDRTNPKFIDNVSEALIMIGTIAVDPLITCLSDSNADVRSASAYILFRIADPRAVEPLILCLSDNDQSVRLYAIYALSVFQDPRAIHPLKQALMDKTKLTTWWDHGKRICDYAAEALEDIGTQEAIEIVKGWRQEELNSSNFDEEDDDLSWRRLRRY